MGRLKQPQPADWNKICKACGKPIPWSVYEAPSTNHSRTICRDSPDCLSKANKRFGATSPRQFRNIKKEVIPVIDRFAPPTPEQLARQDELNKTQSELNAIADREWLEFVTASECRRLDPEEIASLDYKPPGCEKEILPIFERAKVGTTIIQSRHLSY